MTKYYEYFCGTKVSEEALKHGYVDYRAFANSFNHVLANDLMSKTWDIGYWEKVSGFIDNSEEIEALEEENETLREEIERLENLIAESENDEELEMEASIKELEKQITANDDSIYDLQVEENEGEYFQYYIVDDIYWLEKANETVFYNEELDMYLWAVDHWGTSWDYVLTNIKLNEKEEG